MSEGFGNNFADLSKEKRSQQGEYIKQWVVWLGVGSAGGAVAMASLAAHLPNPNHAFGFLLPSLWFFLVGVSSAGASVLILSIKLGVLSEYFAYAHNRAEFVDKIRATPELLSVPKNLAEAGNKGRNDLVREHDKFHTHAEKAWADYVFWNRVWIACVSVSSLGFILGFAWPLAQIGVGKTLIP